VATPPNKCEEWHENRGECSYKPTTWGDDILNEADANPSFENLLMRFEEPSSMVRWDSPLITVAWDEPYPCDAIWQCATSGEKKGPSASVKPVSYHLLPSLFQAHDSEHCQQRTLSKPSPRLLPLSILLFLLTSMRLLRHRRSRYLLRQRLHLALSCYIFLCGDLRCPRCRD